MPAAMLSREVIEDGQGGGYVLQLYPKRTEIVRRDRIGQLKSVGSAFGPASVEVARLWTRALIDRTAQKPV
jgi:hypothetical protein